MYASDNDKDELLLVNGKLCLTLVPNSSLVLLFHCLTRTFAFLSYFILVFWLEICVVVLLSL